MSEASAAVEVVEDAVYHVTQADVEGVYTLLSGMVTVQLFSLLAQLVTLGLVMVVVFVIAMRRF